MNGSMLIPSCVFDSLTNYYYLRHKLLLLLLPPFQQIIITSVLKYKPREYNLEQFIGLFPLPNTRSTASKLQTCAVLATTAVGFARR
jgi:hypothetical protein